MPARLPRLCIALLAVTLFSDAIVTRAQVRVSQGQSNPEPRVQFEPPEQLLLEAARSSADPFKTELWLFPVEDRFKSCPRDVTTWIKKNVGNITVTCKRLDPFWDHMTRYETPLMKARLGLHAFVEVNSRGIPRLRAAVTIPSFDVEKIDSFVLSAGDLEHKIPITTRTRHLIVFPSRETRWLAFELPVDALSPELLKGLKSAEKRVVQYGPDLKKRLKISKHNVGSIDEMVRLYMALAKDAGVLD